MADLTLAWLTSHLHGRPHTCMADLTLAWPTSHLHGSSSTAAPLVHSAASMLCGVGLSRREERLQLVSRDGGLACVGSDARNRPPNMRMQALPGAWGWVQPCTLSARSCRLGHGMGEGSRGRQDGQWVGWMSTVCMQRTSAMCPAVPHGVIPCLPLPIGFVGGVGVGVARRPVRCEGGAGAGHPLIAHELRVNSNKTMTCSHDVT
jgi:hypothetical protein